MIKSKAALTYNYIQFEVIIAFDRYNIWIFYSIYLNSFKIFYVSYFIKAILLIMTWLTLTFRMIFEKRT